MHSNKYYHLIKALRHQQDVKALKKRIHSDKNHRKNNIKEKRITQELVSSIIDQDNFMQINQKDIKIMSKLQQLQTIVEDHERLWEWYKLQSELLKLQKSTTLSLQAKLAKIKDQQLIDTIFESTNHLKVQNASKILKINQSLKQQQNQLTKRRQIMKSYVYEIELYDKQLVKLKQNYDKAQKVMNERSNKFKQQKSRDFMISNINKQDMQMRKIMTSKIKLNQQMDFGFQIQRKREFNQAKQQINEKKKLLQENVNKIRETLDNAARIVEQLINQRQMHEKQNEIMNKELIYFIKKIIKEFKDHSKGIQWLIIKLQEMNVRLKKEDLPEDLSMDDRIFIEELCKGEQFTLKMRMGIMNANFKEKRFFTQSNKQIKSLNKAMNSTTYNIKFKTTNNTPKTTTKQKFFTNIKTQPNQLQEHPFQHIDLDHYNPFKHKASKSNHLIHYDIDSWQQDLHNSRGKVITTDNIINTKSIKKIYENTSSLLSTFIKNRNWDHHQQIIKEVTNAKNNQELQTKDQSGIDQGIIWQKKIIQQKLKFRFMNVRQKQRRNHIKKLLFGQKKFDI